MKDMMRDKKKLLISVGMLVLVATGVISGIIFWNMKKNSAKAKPEEAEKVYKDIKIDLVQEEADPYDVKIDFEKLKEINQDVYAWIKVPGTTVDYPILQSVIEEDEYYLNTTIDGKRGLPGSIYTEKYNTTEFTDPVTIIYGHNMKDDTMFSELIKYREKEFFDKNPYVYIYTPTGRLKYQIFAAVVFDNRYLMGNYNFNEKDDFDKYITEIKKSFEANINEGVEVNNKVLTLSTCTGKTEQRFLVNGVLVEENRY